MSLEQAILDRLEKRNAQIAQLQSTIQALESAADAEREHTRQQLAPVIEENKRLAAQIEDAEVIERRERLIKSLNEEITKRDHELREMDADAKKHREGLQAKENEIQEWLAQLERARQERDAALLEVAKLRAEVPLESTREALTNAVAKLQEVTTDRDRVLNELAVILAEANKSGRCNGDPVALIRQGQVDSDAVAFFRRDNERRDALISKLQADLGRETEDRNQAEADAKTAQADAQRLGDECARLAGKVAELEAQAKCERDKLKARLEPLEKMYVKINSISRENGFVASRFKEVLTAVDETTEALSQLTA